METIEKQIRKIVEVSCENSNANGYFENMIDLYPTNYNKFDKNDVKKVRNLLKENGHKIISCSMGRICFETA